ncbi:hypothetical protein AVEN_219355-1 [Araneus ventricosus]|uniref:Uncharacterized protein n=1 Tax=Araneus ventricosus TaxID=182803 RepID=A0A4Y2BGK9_ARAVE|nr:hypothetical protein AVEN_219355-1 [Araneus ventricosus]
MLLIFGRKWVHMVSPRERSRSAEIGVGASVRRITYATGNACKKSACASRFTCVTPQLPTSAKRSHNSRQPIGFLHAPTVIYILLMEFCRQASNRSTRIGVCARGPKPHAPIFPD